MPFNDRLNPHTLLFTPETDGAASDVWEYSWTFPFSGEIVGFTVANGAAITAGDTNFATVRLSGGSNAIAARSTRVAGTESNPTLGGNLVADTVDDVTLTTTVANKKFTSSTRMNIAKTVGGSGATFTDLCVAVHYMFGHQD